MRKTYSTPLSLVAMLAALFLLPFGCKRICASKPISVISDGGDTLASAIDSILLKEVAEPKLLPEEVTVKRNLAYNKYTLEDKYKYQDTFRTIRWDEIKERLAFIENMQHSKAFWGVLQNYQNRNGEAPPVENYHRDGYKLIADKFGIQRYQSAPLFTLQDTLKPQRYGRDGSPVKILDSLGSFIRLAWPEIEGEWYVPKRYVKHLGASDSLVFRSVVVIDRLYQNIVTMQQKSRGEWEALSINPCTTGLHKPPYAQETPTGIFLLQNRKTKMFYLKDGSSEINGYAPFASRFTNGAYLHGVPTQDPEADYSEWSWSLGTTPRSHMCVRLASSHAKFIFDTFPLWETLVVVIGKKGEGEMADKR